MIRREMIFSEIAKEKLESTLTFLENNWSFVNKRIFLKKIEKCFEHVEEVSKNSDENQIKKYQITRYASLFYKTTEEKIIVYYFKNTKSRKDYLLEMFIVNTLIFAIIIFIIVLVLYFSSINSVPFRFG